MSEPRMLSGRLFQSLGAKCKKVLPPFVDFAILGTTKSAEFCDLREQVGFSLFVLFYFTNKKPILCSTESSPHPSTQNPDSMNWPIEDSAEMGIFLFPSPTTGLSTCQLMVQQVNARYFCQQGADVRDFACDFLIKVDILDCNEADVKEVFNICLDQPLRLQEMEKLGNLGFWDFVYHIYHHGEPELPP